MPNRGSVVRRIGGAMRLNMHLAGGREKIVVEPFMFDQAEAGMAKTGDGAGRVVAGRYRLLGSLGAGGMGRVWLANDQELDCDVVLKELAVPPDLPENELNARIARARSEARHSARLRGNPHVVTVYDCVVDDGLPWIVMEYVPGAETLRQWSAMMVRCLGLLRPALAWRCLMLWPRATDCEFCTGMSSPPTSWSQVPIPTNSAVRGTDGCC